MVRVVLRKLFCSVNFKVDDLCAFGDHVMFSYALASALVQARPLHDTFLPGLHFLCVYISATEMHLTDEHNHLAFA